MMRYREFAQEVALIAGKHIQENFTLGMRKEWKGDNTPVTETDKTINAIVIQKVQEMYPGHGILSEEGSSLVENAEYVWVCDPVDGTLPFSHGLPLSVFSLALTQNGIPILGVIYDPFLGRMFVAEAGKGACMNENPIHVSSTPLSNRTLLNIEGWVYRENAFRLDKVTKKCLEKEIRFFKINSIVYAGALLAAGELDGVLFPGKNGHAWDGAAVKILVEEAGGRVTDVLGNEQRYDQSINGFIASNGVIHGDLLEMVCA